MNQFDLPTNSNHEPIRLNHYFFILPNLFIHPKNETKSALGKGRTWSLILRLETLCLYHYTTRAIATSSSTHSVWHFYWTHFNLTFLSNTFQFALFPDTFQFDPFPDNFQFDLFPDTFRFDLFPDTFQFDLFPDTCQFDRFSGHPYFLKPRKYKFLWEIKN